MADIKKFKVRFTTTAGQTSEELVAAASQNDVIHYYLSRYRGVITELFVDPYNEEVKRI